MNVIPFQPEHLEQLKVKDAYVSGECPKTIMTAAFTFMDGGDVVAIFGGFPFVPGVIHFWGLVSDLVYRKPLSFHRTALIVLDWYKQNEKPRRMQMDVRADYPEGCRWAESLGFEKEGLMRKWGPNGEDFYLYGRAC